MLEINSWTDYGMNWNNPDSSKFEYGLAILLAMEERKLLPFRVYNYLEIFNGQTDAIFNNVFFKYIPIIFDTISVNYSLWFMPEILDNLNTTTPDNYSVKKSLQDMADSCGLYSAKFPLQDRVNKRSWDAVYKFAYTLLNNMYIFLPSIFTSGIGKAVPYGREFNTIFEAISDCDSRWNSASWWSGSINSYEYRVVSTSPGKYRASRSSECRRILIYNPFDCNCELFTNLVYSKGSLDSYYHPNGIPAGIYEYRKMCRAKYITGDEDGFEYNPTHTSYPSGATSKGFYGSLQNYFFIRMNVEGGFKFLSP